MKGKILILFLLSYFGCASLFGYARSNPLQLIKQAEEKGDSILADSLYTLAKQYFRINMDTSLMLAEASARLSERIDYTSGRFTAYRGITAIGVRAGDLDKSLLYVDKGLNLVKEKALTQDQKLDFILNKGSAYLFVNDLGNAIKANIEALSIAKDNDLDDKTAKIYNNMGIIYRKMENYPKAVETYQDGVKIMMQLKDSVGLANTYYNLGAVYAKMDSLQQSYDVIIKAKSTYAGLGMQKETKDCDLALGTAAFDLGQFAASYKLLFPLEHDQSLILDVLDNYRMHIFLSELAVRKNDYKEAKRLLNDIVEIEPTNYLEEKISYYRVKSILEERSNNFKNALHYKNLYQESQEAYTNKASREFRQEMNTKYQTLQKDFEINTLATQQEVTATKLKAAQQRNIGFVIGIILLTIFLWSLYQLYKRIKNQNAIISKANKDKGILLKEIHHRVKNNLQVVTSLLSMQERKVTDQDTKDALKSSKTRVQSMSILHQNLYQGNDLKGVKADRYMSNLIDNIVDTYIVDKKINITIDVDPISIDVDTLIPIGLISNELICNAIKHAFVGREEGELVVSLKETTSKLTLEVKDDGIGIGGDSLPHKSGSLGTRLINSFVQQLDGDISVNNDNGTSIKIEFDKSDLFKLLSNKVA